MGEAGFPAIKQETWWRGNKLVRASAVLAIEKENIASQRDCQLQERRSLAKTHSLERAQPQLELTRNKAQRADDGEMIRFLKRSY